MLVWTVFLFFCFSSFFPFWDVQSLSYDLHELCLEKLHFKGQLKNIYESLVCGKRLPPGHLKELFIHGGLIHLTVVSGAHLLFLEKLWKKLPLPALIKTHGLFIILILYAFASRLYPPVVRALFSFFLFRLSQSFKLFWSAHLVTLLSGLLCLLYQPSWVHSFSLQLSLLACFLQNISTNPLKKCFFIYLFILPVVNRWQALHPFTVLINWTAAPLISSLLFPLTFLSPMVPGLYPLTDRLWSITLQTLKLVRFFPSQSPFMDWFVPDKWIWLYIAMVCLILFTVHWFRRRRLYHSKKEAWL